MPSHCSFKPDLHELWSKEGVGVKLKIWFPTINPLKVRVKWGPTGACYTLLEDIFKGYKILPLHFQKLLDLRNIWTSKIFE